ncbi:uncharacterized protein [Antedon mediterranea]|uniref:uncharacterized protein isoform X2 n=1 Tax=Antedon mediterranea TaxID=105859 RepID=UPI003AF538B5
MFTSLRCTLPGCSCECFNPCKTQLRSCQSCQHGWVAHDALTEEEVFKVRKKGSKNGRSCQYPRCDCNDYISTCRGMQASWLAKCDSCKHSDSDHRIPTHFDLLRSHNARRAGTTPCIACVFDCQGFGKPDDSISQDSPLSKQCTFCAHNIENHRPKMETDVLILSILQAKKSVRCQKSLETNKLGKVNGYDMKDWFEAVNVDPDERQDVSGVLNCYCRGFTVDDPARVCHTYYGLMKEIVLPHLSTINCQRCSHDFSNHRQLEKEEQREKEIENERKLRLLSMNKIRIATKDMRHPVAMFTPDDILPEMFAFARVLENEENKTILKINFAAIGASQSKAETIKEIKRKRTNSGKFLDAVKNKLKKRKLVNTSDENESDELKSEESANCSDCESSFTKFKNKFKRKSEELHDAPDIVCNSIHDFLKRPTTLEEQTSSVINDLMDSTKEISIELTKSDVNALAWGKSVDDTNTLLAVGFQDGSLMIYTVSVGMAMKLEKYNYDGMEPVSKLLWIQHSNTRFVAVGHINGQVSLMKVTDHGTSKSCVLQNENKKKVTAIAESPSGCCICVGQQNGSISFYLIDYNEAKPKLLSASSISYGAVQSIAWHPTKNIVIAAGEDDNITVFYMETLTDRKRDRRTIMHYLGKKRRFELDVFSKCCKLKGHLSFVSAVRFDPSGDFLISVGWDGQILFWNTADIDDVISYGAGDISTVECSTGFMIGQQKFSNFPSDGMNFMPFLLSLVRQIVYILAYTDSETLCLVAYQAPKKYR